MNTRRGSRDSSPQSATDMLRVAEEDRPHEDELAAYLALPQINYETEWDALDWWKANAKKFPNLSVMARQYLGCPATSATVERFVLTGGDCFLRSAQELQSINNR